MKLNVKEDTLDGITASIDKIPYKNNKGSIVFYPGVTITNSSDKSIMSVSYDLHVYNKAGEEFHTIHVTWNGQDTPLEKDCSVKQEKGFRLPGEAPHSFSVEVTGYNTAEEMPPVHVPQAGEYLYEAVNNSHIAGISGERPVRIRIYIDHGGDAETADVTDSGTIARLADAFVKIKIGTETNTAVTDNYNYVEFEFADGTVYFLSLNLQSLEMNIYEVNHIYELTDFGEFWDLINELADYE